MIGILGAGALGCMWAGYLSRHVPTVLLNRPGCTDTHRHFVLQTPAGQDLPTTIPCSTTRQADACALLLVATKSADVMPALEDVFSRHPRMCERPVVLLQNGLASQTEARDRWPRACLLAATTTEGANRRGDRVIHAGAGTTLIGALTDPARPLISPVCEQLAVSGRALQTCDDILRPLWQKLAINAGINPFTALLNCNNGTLSGHPLFEARIQAVCQETAQVMCATLPGSGNPESCAADLEARVRSVIRSTAANISSMLQDVRAGRPTEIDAINGYIVQRGQALGISTPTNQWLCASVKGLSG